jgi:putative peptidoglycan lipid II flippase
MKQTIQLGILSATNIGISFLFQWYVLIQLGPGIETDALFAGMAMPQLVLAVISGSLMHVLVPLLAGEDETRLRQNAWGFFVLVGSLFSFLAITLYVSATWWVPLSVPGFSEEGKILTIELTRIQLIAMVFSAVNGVQWAAYHARQQFIWAESTPIFAGVFGLLLLIWALPHYGVIAAAWISALRMALQTFLLTSGMGRPVWPDLNSPAIRSAWQRIKPLLLGTAYYKTDPLLDRYLLSAAGSGSLSLFNLAQQIYGAISQVIHRAIAVPLVPLLSKMSKSGDRRDFRRAYYRKLMQIGILSIAGLLLLGFIGELVLDFLIGYGNVSSRNVKELWWIMLWLSGMFMGGLMGQICSSCFYATGDTITPTRMSIFTYTAYIPCKVVAFYLWEVKGLAVVTSIYFTVNWTLQAYLLERKNII